MGRLGRITPSRLRRELADRSSRARHWLSLRRRFGAGVESRPLFVVGCQRSGTNMVMWTLERSPDVWVYHEHHHSAAFLDYRLRSTATLERLIRRCPAPVVAFKPVADCHLTDRYLARHAGARAIWIYRHHTDVANSLVRAFGEHQRDILRWIVNGDSDWLGWRGERLPGDVVSLVRECFRESMSLEEAAALVWYMRTRFFFELGLEDDERVLLVRYEALVADGSGASFRRLFEFADLPFRPEYLSHVFSSSVGKHPRPSVDPRIERACEDLQQRLDAAYERAIAREAAHGAAAGAGAGPDAATRAPEPERAHGR